MLGHAKVISIGSPVKGVVRTISREQQAPDTCWDANNIVPYDRFGRLRVGQRTGMSKAFVNQIGSGSTVQGLLPVHTILYGGSSSAVNGVPFYTGGGFQQAFGPAPAGWSYSGTFISIGSTAAPGTSVAFQGTAPSADIFSGTFNFVVEVPMSYSTLPSSTWNGEFTITGVGATVDVDLGNYIGGSATITASLRVNSIFIGSESIHLSTGNQNLNLNISVVPSTSVDSVVVVSMTGIVAVSSTLIANPPSATIDPTITLINPGAGHKQLPLMIG